MTDFYPEVETAIEYTMYYSDWAGTVEEWQKAYFKLISWKNTWGLTWMLDLLSARDGDAVVKFIISDSDANINYNSVEDYLKELGYTVHSEKIKVLTVDYQSDDDFDYAFFE